MQCGEPGDRPLTANAPDPEPKQTHTVVLRRLETQLNAHQAPRPTREPQEIRNPMLKPTVEHQKSNPKSKSDNPLRADSHEKILNPMQVFYVNPGRANQSNTLARHVTHRVQKQKQNEPLEHGMTSPTIRHQKKNQKSKPTRRHQS
ncbi:hypothetical protein K439DRAFT_708047 [Ramaria rubella]|nr:hypothetical protein K439DRAFT_708047 [Ramaria rubella]